MKWLNSLGELLYEIMSWLIFYPITLWRTISSPLRTMGYADQELHDKAEEQFTDTLNPPLFLILSLLLTQAIDKTLGGGINPIVAQNSGLASFITDDTTLLLLRLILFSLFPLMMAARFLRAKQIKLTRRLLKGPFYAQCYACAPFALALGIGTSLVHTRISGAQLVGSALSLGSVVAYLFAETLWFSKHLAQSRLKALGNVIRAFVEAAVLALTIATLF